MSEPAAPDQKKQNMTNMPVGEILRRTRLHYKQEIPDVERAIRIRAVQIEAIESGDLSKLPGRVYAIGFVRSYSEFLGLDGDKMVELFKQQSAGKTATPELNFPAGDDDTKLPPFWLVGLCLVVIVVVLAYWASSTTKERQTVNDIPPVPVASGPPKASQQVVVPDQAGTPVATPGDIAPVPQQTATTPDQTISEKPKEGIILNIRENSWVEIKDQAGKTVLSRVLQAGDQYFVPDRPDLAISIGNAGGVEVEVDGQKLRPLGKKGEVRRSLQLDAEYLKKNFAETSAPR
jgi:cytoskeleton protein RodZ